MTRVLGTCKHKSLLLLLVGRA